MPRKKGKKKQAGKVRAKPVSAAQKLAEHKKHLAKLKAHLAALSKEEVLPKWHHRNFLPKISSEVRSVFVIALVAVTALAAFSFFVSFTDDTAKTPLSDKLPKASVLDEAASDEDVTLVATGDILLARYVELLMRKQKDYTWPFLKVADTLRGADITFGNLETPFFPGANTPRDSTTFRADPAAVEGLQYAGFDVLSIANNHMMNYQVPGLTTTLQTLRKAEIFAAGGGKNQDVAHTPTMISAKGKMFAFYSYVDAGIARYGMGIAKTNAPGIARMEIEAVKNDVKNALANGADYVIVSMHAGTEYTQKLTNLQQDFARAAIDAGASIVFGAHPHVVQGVEHYGSGLIFYSLGNFVFDQFFSQDVQTGLVAKVIFKQGGGLGYELLPVKIEKTQPRFLEGEEREAALTKYNLQ